MRVVLFVISIILSFVARSQSPLDYARYAEEALASSDYYGAALYYRKANQLDSTQHEWFWLEATALMKYHQYPEALEVYQYIESNFRKDFPSVPVYIALCYKSMGQYQRAQEVLDAFIATRPKRSTYEFRKAEQELHALEMALLPQEESEWVLDTLPEPINTKSGDYAPTLHGQSLLVARFISAKAIHEDHQVRIDRLAPTSGTDAFTDTTELDAPSEWQNARQITYSYDDQHAYAVACNDEGCRIEYSSRFGKDWTVPVKLNGDINLEGYRIAHVHYAEIKGKCYLLFSSDRPRGKGGMDLWMVEIKEHGEKYGRTKSLGRNINQRDDQITPFYDTANQVLTFSSDWHVGYGGFDIFSSTGSGRSWSEPSNMGQPFNSIGNDLYFSVYGDTAYWASNRPGSIAAYGEMCCNDIFRARLEPQVVDTPLLANDPDTIILSEQPQLVDFTPIVLYFHNDRPNPRSYTDTTDITYYESWTQYEGLRASYLKQSNEPAFIKQFFDSVLTKANMQLDTLYARLNYLNEAGYQINLGVRGYTSSLAKNSYNSRLAQRRITSFSNGLYQTIENPDLVDVQNIPLGEFFSELTVSDDINNVSESIYGPAAIVSRRVEVVALSIEERGKSNIEISDYFIDLGVIDEGMKRTVSFEISNSGSSSVELKELRTACGCSSASFEEAIIDAQSKTRLNVEYDSTGKSGAQFVPIYFNTDHGQFVVYLKVYVKA